MFRVIIIVAGRGYETVRRVSTYQRAEEVAASLPPNIWYGIQERSQWAADGYGPRLTVRQGQFAQGAPL